MQITNIKSRINHIHSGMAPPSSSDDKKLNMMNSYENSGPNLNSSMQFQNQDDITKMVNDSVVNFDNTHELATIEPQQPKSSLSLRSLLT